MATGGWRYAARETVVSAAIMLTSDILLKHLDGRMDLGTDNKAIKKVLQHVATSRPGKSFATVMSKTNLNTAVSPGPALPSLEAVRETNNTHSYDLMLGNGERTTIRINLPNSSSTVSANVRDRFNQLKAFIHDMMIKASLMDKIFMGSAVAIIVVGGCYLVRAISQPFPTPKNPEAIMPATDDENLAAGFGADEESIASDSEGNDWEQTESYKFLEEKYRYALELLVEKSSLIEWLEVHSAKQLGDISNLTAKNHSAAQNVIRLGQELSEAKEQCDDSDEQLAENDNTIWRLQNDLKAERDKSRAKDAEINKLVSAHRALDDANIEYVAGADRASERERELRHELRHARFNLDQAVVDLDQVKGELKESREGAEEIQKKLDKTEADLEETVFDLEMIKATVASQSGASEAEVDQGDADENNEEEATLPPPEEPQQPLTIDDASESSRLPSIDWDQIARIVNTSTAINSPNPIPPTPPIHFSVASPANNNGPFVWEGRKKATAYTARRSNVFLNNPFAGLELPGVPSSRPYALPEVPEQIKLSEQTSDTTTDAPSLFSDSTPPPSETSGMHPTSPTPAAASQTPTSAHASVPNGTGSDLPLAKSDDTSPKAQTDAEKHPSTTDESTASDQSSPAAENDCALPSEPDQSQPVAESDSASLIDESTECDQSSPAAENECASPTDESTVSDQSSPPAENDSASPNNQSTESDQPRPVAESDSASLTDESTECDHSSPAAENECASLTEEPTESDQSSPTAESHSASPGADSEAEEYLSKTDALSDQIQYPSSPSPILRAAGSDDVLPKVENEAGESPSTSDDSTEIDQPSLMRSTTLPTTDSDAELPENMVVAGKRPRRNSSPASFTASASQLSTDRPDMDSEAGIIPHANTSHSSDTSAPPEDAGTSDFHSSSDVLASMSESPASEAQMFPPHDILPATLLDLSQSIIPEDLFPKDTTPVFTPAGPPSTPSATSDADPAETTYPQTPVNEDEHQDVTDGEQEEEQAEFQKKKKRRSRPRPKMSLFETGTWIKRNVFAQTRGLIGIFDEVDVAPVVVLPKESDAEVSRD